MQSSYLTDKDRRRKGGAVGAFVVFLLFLRFSGLVAGAKRGDATFVWAVGLLILFIAAVIYWPKFSFLARPFRVKMSELTKENPNSRELLTEVLDSTGRRSVLKIVVNFLRREELSGKFECISDSLWLAIERAAARVGSDDPTERLREFHRKWRERRNDRMARSVGFSLLSRRYRPRLHALQRYRFTYLTSAYASLLLELGHEIKASGIKVYDCGRLL